MKHDTSERVLAVNRYSLKHLLQLVDVLVYNALLSYLPKCEGYCCGIWLSLFWPLYQSNDFHLVLVALKLLGAYWLRVSIERPNNDNLLQVYISVPDYTSDHHECGEHFHEGSQNKWARFCMTAQNHHPLEIQKLSIICYSSPVVINIYKSSTCNYGRILRSYKIHSKHDDLKITEWLTLSHNFSANNNLLCYIPLVAVSCKSLLYK